MAVGMTSPDVNHFSGELRLLPRLVSMLHATGRLRADTLLATELPWHGRRVDLATLTRSGVLSAYELKLGRFGRVLEQAIYNRLSFDRSWIVVGEGQGAENLSLAVRHEIGVIVVNGYASIISPAPLVRNDPVLRHRLTSKIRAVGGSDV
jgi:hypothetical protein